MNSPNNPNHNKFLDPRQPNPQQLQLAAFQAEQAQRSAHAHAEALLANTASRIFAGLVIEEWRRPPDLAEPFAGIPAETYRTMARVAKEAAPFFGEALGICQINPTKGDGQNADGTLGVPTES